MSQTHPACIREAISQVLSRHGDGAEARRNVIFRRWPALRRTTSSASL